MSGYNVTIIDNETGEQRIYREQTDWDDHHHYLWTLGNYECDCNRYRMFYDEDDDDRCGSERFYCPHATLDDGEVIPLDEPERCKQAACVKSAEHHHNKP